VIACLSQPAEELSWNAQLIGKANMDEFGMGSFGANSPFFGPVLLPSSLDDAPGLERVAGGSSSGTAAAVAAGMADLYVLLHSCVYTVPAGFILSNY
jgi:hypothetical protein